MKNSFGIKATQPAGLKLDQNKYSKADVFRILFISKPLTAAVLQGKP
jgi:hypothetical protein